MHGHPRTRATGCAWGSAWGQHGHPHPRTPAPRVGMPCTRPALSHGAAPPTRSITTTPAAAMAATPAMCTPGRHSRHCRHCPTARHCRCVAAKNVRFGHFKLQYDNDVRGIFGINPASATSVKLHCHWWVVCSLARLPPRAARSNALQRPRRQFSAAGVGSEKRSTQYGLYGGRRRYHWALLGPSSTARCTLVRPSATLRDCTSRLAGFRTAPPPGSQPRPSSHDKKSLLRRK